MNTKPIIFPALDLPKTLIASLLEEYKIGTPTIYLCNFVASYAKPGTVTYQYRSTILEALEGAMMFHVGSSRCALETCLICINNLSDEEFDRLPNHERAMRVEWLNHELRRET